MIELAIYEELIKYIPTSTLPAGLRRMLMSVLTAPFPKWPPQPHYINQVRARLNIFWQLMDHWYPLSVPTQEIQPEEITA